MGASSIKDGILTSIKTDNPTMLSQYLNELVPNDYINSSKTFTCLNICACFGSIKCCSLLITKGWRVDQPEKEKGNSPLLLSIKFGYEELTKKLIKEYKANINYVNYAKLNCLDCAIVYSRYSIAYFLIYELGMKICKSITQYKEIMLLNDIYMYQIEPFYNNLLMKQRETNEVENDGNVLNITERNETFCDNMSIVDIDKIMVNVDKKK